VILILLGVDIGSLLVCHRCDQPACINPDHLFLGTHQDNNDDCISKGRDKHARGGAHGSAKLTERDVIDIRSGRLKNHELAALYGVSKRTIISVKTGLTWRHIAGRAALAQEHPHDPD